MLIKTSSTDAQAYLYSYCSSFNSANATVSSNVPILSTSTFNPLSTGATTSPILPTGVKPIQSGSGGSLPSINSSTASSSPTPTAVNFEGTAGTKRAVWTAVAITVVGAIAWTL